MEMSDTPCTRRDMFKTMLGELASATGAVVSSYADGLSAALDAGAAAARPAREAFVRPPGAVAEDRFLELCTRCDDCVKACPEWVVRKTGPEFGARYAGYPVLLPAENPCVFCEGLPCAAACKTGALVMPAPGAPARVGLAKVDAAKCYMSAGQPCDYCAKECPVRPKAVSVGARGRPALVDAAACTGCGGCAQICPANAITIEAMR